MKEPRWTDPEKAFLKANWQVMDDEQLAAFLPGRTPQSCLMKRTRMGLLHRRPITMRDIRKVEHDIIRHTRREIGEDIGRTEGAVKQILHRFGIKSPIGASKRVAA